MSIAQSSAIPSKTCILAASFNFLLGTSFNLWYSLDVVRTNRFILLLSIAVIAVQGMGILRTFHNLTHHDTHTSHKVTLEHAHHEHDEQTPTKQAPFHPSDNQDDRNDQDCELCLSFNTLTTTLNDPPNLPLLSNPITQNNSQPLAVVRSTYTPSDNPARAPPLHMIRS